MKNTDKVTINFEQLKKMVKESNDAIDNIFDQMEILDELSDTVTEAIAAAKEVINLKREDERNNSNLMYEGHLRHILKLVDEIKKFDIFVFGESNLNGIVKEVKQLAESTPEQVEARRMAEQAKVNGEYYAIGYMDASNYYPDFLGSSKNKDEVLKMAKDMMTDEDGTLFYETVNVCDPNGYIVKTFEADTDEDRPYWGTEY